MQLRPHPNGHQNVILCFLGCAPGTFLQVNQRNTEAYLHDKYPGASEHYGYLQTQLFLTEVAAVDFCVNLVIDNYVQMTSEMFTNRGEQTSYLRKAGRANKRWIDHR